MRAKTVEEQISALSAKVTALTMLVEALWVDELAKEENPAAFGKQFVDDIFKTDEKARKRLGESDYVLQISEVITSLMDRAVARAVRLRRPKGHRRG